MLDPVVNKTSVRFSFPAEDIVKKRWPYAVSLTPLIKRGGCWGAERRGGEGGVKAELLLITEPDEPVNHGSPRQQLSTSSLKITPLEATRACWPIKPQRCILADHVWAVSMCGENTTQMLQSIPYYSVLKSTSGPQVKGMYWREASFWEKSYAHIHIHTYMICL